MSEDWKSKKTPEQLEIMWKNAKLGRYISILGLTLVWITLLILSFISVFGIYKLNSLDESNSTKLVRPLFIKAEFIYNAQITPYYEMTWIIQYLCTVFIAFVFIAIDAFFAVLVLHLCGQLINLSNDIKYLPKQVHPTTEDQMFEKLITEIISKHIQLSRFAYILEDSFNVMFLFQMLASSLLFSLQGYQLIMILTTGTDVSFFEFFFMLYFALSFIFSLFLYCYIAEVLRTESMKLGNAAYECDWYNLQPLHARFLILIMIRARKPFQLTAGKFFEFSLGLYASILKSCAGYTSMLIAMKKRLA